MYFDKFRIDLMLVVAEFGLAALDNRRLIL